MDESLLIYDPFSVTQILGYIAMCFGIAAFLQKNDTRLKICLTILTCFLAVHFLFLDRISATLATLLIGSRSALSIFESVRAHAKFFVGLYTCMALMLGYYAYETWLDFFPIVAAISGSVAFFTMHGIRLRIMLLFGSVMWLTHNILSYSYGPAVMEAFICSCNLFTVYRLLQDQKKLPSHVKEQL